MPGQMITLFLASAIVLLSRASGAALQEAGARAAELPPSNTPPRSRQRRTRPAKAAGSRSPTFPHPTDGRHAGSAVQGTGDHCQITQTKPRPIHEQSGSSCLAFEGTRGHVLPHRPPPSRQLSCQAASLNTLTIPFARFPHGYARTVAASNATPIVTRPAPKIFLRCPVRKTFFLSSPGPTLSGPFPG
jgi:hypothetical protein